MFVCADGEQTQGLAHASDLTLSCTPSPGT